MEEHVVPAISARQKQVLIFYRMLAPWKLLIQCLTVEVGDAHFVDLLLNFVVNISASAIVLLGRRPNREYAGAVRRA